MLPDGRNITIKSAGPEDALKIKLHREKVCRETHFLAREPEDGPWNPEMIRARFESIANDDKAEAVADIRHFCGVPLIN